MSEQFTWEPIYRELADRLLDWETRQGELIALLEQIRSDGYVVSPLMDKDAEDARYLVRELDPFTFFGTFNRGIRDDQRLGILAQLKRHFDLTSALPVDFAGIPILNNQKSWFVAYQYQRQPEDVPRLWRVFRLALGDHPLDNPEFGQAFDDALKVRNTNFNLTMGFRDILKSRVLVRKEKAAYPAGDSNVSFHQRPDEGTRTRHEKAYRRCHSESRGGPGGGGSSPVSGRQRPSESTGRTGSVRSEKDAAGGVERRGPRVPGSSP
jgi:hypothetical protein